MCILKLTAEHLISDKESILNKLEYLDKEINLNDIDSYSQVYKDFKLFDCSQMNLKINSLLTENNLRTCTENGFHIETFIVKINLKGSENEELTFYNEKLANNTLRIIENSLLVHRNNL